MQALKALVIVMGVLIVVGTTIVVVTIYNRMTRLGEAGEAAAPAASGTEPVSGTVPGTAPAAAVPASFGAARVVVPDGCRVVEMVPAGERLLLRLGSVARCNRILVVDLASGAELGSIELAPGDAAP